jgi:hypothetical protein
MELLPSDLKPVAPPTSAGFQLAGLLLCRDLIFTTKVKGTAAELGYPLVVATARSQAESMIKTYWPRVVLIDLTAGDMAAPGALSAYQKLAGAGACFVAFGPHVEVDALAKAKAAGCHVVMPRSRFAAELPELMRQFFSQPMVGNG